MSAGSDQVQVTRHPVKAIAKERIVDSVGAGDSFTASMTLGLLEGKDYPQILKDACKVAAGVCSHAGAVPH